MPIYEYECGGCHYEFEHLVRGDEQVRCPHCQGEQLERKWSVPAVGRMSGEALPVCDMPRMGGCGAPACQSRCQFE